MADHELGRGIDRVGPLSRVRDPGRETPKGGRRRAAAADEPRATTARPGRRPPAGQGPHEAADRVRRHVGAARRGRCCSGSASSAQSNDRVSELGPLQQRAAAYGQLQSDIASVRLLLPENLPGRRFYKVWPGAAPIPLRGDARVAVDQAVANQVKRIAPATAPDRLGFTPPAEDESVLGEIREESHRLSSLMDELIRRSERFQTRAGDGPGCRPQPAGCGARECHDGEGRRPDRPERKLLRELAEPVHRRRGGGDRPRAPARVRPLVVGDRPHPADRRSPGRDRVGRLLGARRRREPRRARVRWPPTSTG